MKKAPVTLNLYLPTTAKKREIKRKAKALNRSVSEVVIAHFNSLSDSK